MARATFGDAEFVVEGGETVPLPRRPQRGFPTWEATILLPTAVDYVYLQDAYTQRTDERALGSTGGYVVVHSRGANGGQHTLRIPIGDGGALVTFDAILNDFAPDKFQNDTQGWYGRARISFVILSGVTP